MSRVRADAVRREHPLGVAVVGSHEADAAGGVRRLEDDPEALVGDLDRLRRLTNEEIDDRYEMFKLMSQFEVLP